MLASVRVSEAIRSVCLAGALIGTPVVSMSDTPIRAVSMNLCTDQLAMLVAGEGQLLSVSHLASDPRSSAMVEQAAHFHSNRGLAEEIYLLQPDLVIAGSFSTRATVDMLKRLGIPVVVFDPAYSLEDVRARLTQMGVVLDQQDRAARLIKDYDASLTAYRAEVTSRPRAALYYANGYTSGDKTLAGQILNIAGLDNIAAEQGFSAGGIIPLEVLAMAQPDTVITSRPYRGASRSEEVKGHPVIEALRRSRPEASMTDGDWVCGTPFVLRAIDDMVALRREMQDVQQ
ncbi:ABC transporter substrate-binding protein [Sulfitobacter sp. M57]|uniref:ABC transporter substrate-binding protein n=2 Tax=unclassified Sulfitobacter TaxID=196795 RepID=UPI0023E2B075|nr:MULTISPECIES: ABC transporter substrate-binding protein [unclassified Sulfitobacter]MDF3433086.1 ABC transporter substrate-binding protein [Sulfitobacter sp. KE42]MDF3458726.1 ABC transporter substrate-binding protein [Sulfitobacter sp. S74]MDF3462626.1 ABC transporter substrate-binding protein [Sulfitobacter sp. Ks18]MDF3509283.1 ABC transporter substrate-binding protein [Sulfitobacter sp. M57]MDF3513182.1 ABC transporter substrate-binding protein [Sulfitobacter sp. M36]MDF3520974.1 ABC t